VTRRLALPAVRLLVVVAAFAAWELAAKAAASPYFPPPSAILAAMHRLWFSGPAAHLWLTSDATANLLPSLGRMLGGWAAASAVGVAAGVAIGRLPVLADLTEPIVHFGRSVPAPMLVPAFFLLFSIGTQMVVATIIFGVIWPVVLNSIDGARHVHPTHLETARAFRLPPVQRMFRVVLPSAAPKIFAGLRIGLGLALVMMIISEFVGSTNGIGREMLEAQTEFNVSEIWGIIVLLGLIGVVLNLAVAVVEHRVLAGRPGQQEIS
jgi:ABC-type nitrate/sulfonate/bicarbonate transport system permease component